MDKWLGVTKATIIDATAYWIQSTESAGREAAEDKRFFYFSFIIAFRTQRIARKNRPAAEMNLVQSNLAHGTNDNGRINVTVVVVVVGSGPCMAPTIRLATALPMRVRHSLTHTRTDT